MEQASNPAHALPRSRLIYVGRDKDLPEALAPHLQPLGVALATLPRAEDPCPLDVSGADVVALVDARPSAASGALAATVAALRRRFGPLSRLLCLAPSNKLEWRLRALRAGADGFVPTSEGRAGGDGVAARLTDLIAGARRAPRVLVVDDQPVAALFASRVLEGAKMQVRAVHDPLVALDELVAFRPDLVLMDLHMPGVSGTELTRIIRDHDEFYAMPIVFLSGEIDPALQMETLRVGGDDFLGKPVAPQRLIAVVQDRLRRARDRYGELGAGHGLSPLMDRRAFLRRIERKIATTPAGDPTQGVVVIALDHLRPVGGQVREMDAHWGPIDVASALAPCLGVGDTLAELGERRFAVLASRNEQEELLRLGRRCRDALGDFGAVGIGLATFDRPVEDALTLLSRAERSLAGDGRPSPDGPVAAAVPDQGPPADARLARVIARALQAQGLELLFQPVVPLRQNRGEPYDVCLRLRTPAGEYLAPADFLPAARRAGLARAIDRWVLEQALGVLQQGLLEHRPLRLLIHQHLAGAAQADWHEHLREQIASRGLIKQRPMLRLALAELIEDQARAATVFEALHRLGIGVCLDDLDTGKAALELTEQLCPAMIRLASGDALALGSTGLSALVGRLHRRGVLVLIGGVEDPLTISQVWPAGVDLIQGNFVQPPSAGLDFDFGETVLG